MHSRLGMILVLALIPLVCLGAIQESGSMGIIDQIYGIPSPTGHEHLLAEKIRALLPGELVVVQDPLGSLFARQGSEDSLMAVLCGMDEMGYIVSGIHAEGYLHLDRVVPAPHRLFDTIQFGHPMTVWTQKGPVPGVLALPSLHIFPRGRREELAKIFSLPNALLDIGAGSKQEALDRGIAFLDPVTPLREIISLAGGKASGAALADKTCAAVVLSVARAAERRSLGMAFGWLAQSKFRARRPRPAAALGALRASHTLEAEEYIVVDALACGADPETSLKLGAGPVLLALKKGESGLAQRVRKTAFSKNIPLQEKEGYDSPMLNAFLGKGRDAVGLCLPAKFLWTPSEVIAWEDVQALETLLSAVLEERRRR